jgi:Lrp/AsnC family transcriptional regulator for asnA, asnC and gidA
VIGIPLDTVDEGILRELQIDGRRAYREIARTVGVSEGTVRARVKRLRDAGVLRILAFVDPSSIGQSVLALVFVKVDSPSLRPVVEAVTLWPEVTYASSLIGRADLYLQVICAGSPALWDLLQRLRALPGVRDTETMLEMDVHKFSYRNVPTGPKRS